jgi:hypothetical protein
MVFTAMKLQVEVLVVSEVIRRGHIVWIGNDCVCLKYSYFMFYYKF